MNILPFLKSMLARDSKKEVTKIKVVEKNKKIEITLFFIDNTKIIDTDAKIKPFIISSLKKGLKSENIDFEIDFINEQIFKNESKN